MTNLPDYPIDSREAVRSYCRYSLNLYLNIETDLKEMHGQNPPAWLVEATFNGALQPLSDLTSNLNEGSKESKNSEPVKPESSQEQNSENIKTPGSWLEAMSRKFNLDITNPKRVRMKTRLVNGTYADLLSKMTQHGYILVDHDFVLPEANYV